MKYLINLNKKSSKAHLWDYGDTYCKMYSTGGMRKKKYKIYENALEREICLMCKNVWSQIHEYKEEDDLVFFNKLLKLIRN